MNAYMISRLMISEGLSWLKLLGLINDCEINFVCEEFIMVWECQGGEGGSENSSCHQY